ncbi:hypothetical protein C8Q76DRAFT_623440 [Earliella scabrosa]|nr:hypothetical protein C8Q76DRAFT_623440 [Earliella scabrosa]
MRLLPAPSPRGPARLQEDVPTRGVKEVYPCSLHFVDHGNAVIVSYVYHGILCWDMATSRLRWRIDVDHPVARAALSPDHDLLIAYDLLGGFACYRTDHLSLVRTYPVSRLQGVLLPSLFVHDGHAIAFGSAAGEVTIVNMEDGRSLQTLRHEGMY